MCILFDKCNLNCKFCFEANKTKTIDVEYIKSLPQKFWNEYNARLDRDQFNVIEITMMGGEVFNGVLDDSLYQIYRDICFETYQIFQQNNCNIDININWLSNGVFKNRDRVDQLLKETRSTISFSYDCVDRFPSNRQRDMMLSNVKYYSENHYLNAILITPTKRSIASYIAGKSDIEYLRQYCNVLDLSYYIPGRNFEQLNPSDDEIFSFYKWILDNQIFEFKDIREMLKPFQSDYLPGMEIYKTCNCDQLVNITPYGSTNICVSINSPLTLNRFYGKYTNKINEQTIRIYRSTLGKQKRGCNTCNWSNICVMPCWTAILFDDYSISQCPLYKLYDYIKSRPDIIEKYNIWRTINE